MHSNATDLKDVIQIKQVQKRSEQETEKLLEIMAAKCNDSLLNKSINDYQQLIQSKELRNQLIIKAQRDRTL